MTVFNPLRRAILGSLSLFCTGALARVPTGAPALLLAREAAPDVDPAGFLVSEKLDGVRAFWDGEVLRFRGGGVIAAPPWFLARLPRVALDGELWLGRGRFEELSALARRQQAPDAAWQQVRFMVFELPGAAGSFAARHARLQALIDPLLWPQLFSVEQHVVPSNAALHARLQAVVKAGGEGLMLHRADAPYVTGRQAVLLKLKPHQDAEAMVIGHLPGRGKHAGRLGALQVRNAAGVEFALGSGLSDAQREQPPRVGEVVTYTYRGVTAAGVPRFATFLRWRGVG